MAQISWAFLVYCAAVLAAGWFIVNKLEFHPLKIIEAITREFKSIADMKWTRGSVNALTVIVICLIVMMYFFFDRAKQVIEFVHNAHGPASNSYELVICIFLIAVFALLSARSLPE